MWSILLPPPPPPQPCPPPSPPTRRVRRTSGPSPSPLALASCGSSSSPTRATAAKASKCPTWLTTVRLHFQTPVKSYSMFRCGNPTHEEIFSLGHWYRTSFIPCYSLCHLHVVFQRTISNLLRTLSVTVDCTPQRIIRRFWKWVPLPISIAIVYLIINFIYIIITIIIHFMQKNAAQSAFDERWNVISLP